MSKFENYKDRYEFIRLERNEGVLELTIHNKGGPATWSSHVGGLHDEMGQCFYEVGRDPETKVIIITGSGDQFLTELDWSVPIPDIGTVPFWDRITREGKDLLMNLLEIDVPVIGAVNGPATIHAEIPTMSDIVICSDNAIFADHAHSPSNVVPGDGVHVWWQMVLGPNRGRRFLLLGEEISAKEALQLGFVSEVLPAAKLMDRARELARFLAQKPVSMLRGSRNAFSQHIKRRMLDDLGYGLQMEGINVLAMMQAQAGGE